MKKSKKRTIDTDVMVIVFVVVAITVLSSLMLPSLLLWLSYRAEDCRLPRESTIHLLDLRDTPTEIRDPAEKDAAQSEYSAYRISSSSPQEI